MDTQELFVHTYMSNLRPWAAGTSQTLKTKSPSLPYSFTLLKIHLFHATQSNKCRERCLSEYLWKALGKRDKDFTVWGFSLLSRSPLFFPEYYIFWSLLITLLLIKQSVCPGFSNNRGHFSLSFCNFPFLPPPPPPVSPHFLGPNIPLLLLGNKDWPDSSHSPT